MIRWSIIELGYFVPRIKHLLIDRPMTKHVPHAYLSTMILLSKTHEVTYCNRHIQPSTGPQSSLVSVLLVNDLDVMLLLICSKTIFLIYFKYNLEFHLVWKLRFIKLYNGYDWAFAHFFPKKKKQLRISWQIEYNKVYPNPPWDQHIQLGRTIYSIDCLLVKLQYFYPYI